MSAVRGAEQGVTTNQERELERRLSDAGQEHLWRHRAMLPADLRDKFTQQLADVAWEVYASLLRDVLGIGVEEDKRRVSEASKAKPPRDLIRQPKNEAETKAWQAARDEGEKLLRSGKVAAVVVAGGQGTRLGFDLPKGMYPIGPVSGHSLFQIFCEQIRARSRRAGRDIPYCIMTSDATHDATERFFRDNNDFGLADNQVRFFQQGSIPAFDAQTHRALLSGPGQLAMSPDGHGGLIAALAHSGLIDWLLERGVETLFYHQVDNPTTVVCDPAFLGWHALYKADVSTKVVAKRSAEEKMGVAVSVDGVSKIIEYSDFPADVAAQQDPQGHLVHWAGNTAIHVFQLEFLRRFATGGEAFPFHVARKAVPYLTEAGEVVAPAQPNALKLERFIFDLLPKAERSLIVEADRAAEFNPVKNKDGHDSPRTCRAGMQALHRRWLREAGATIGDDVPIEISPLFALDSLDVKQQFDGRSVRFDAATFLTKDG
jgi:UDP-N-acetylglucosamine/UDP-N-acetylgalactosamine diphosphorylase